MNFPSYDWIKGYKDTGEVEKDLRGFIYLGDGWYETDTDTLYVTGGPGAVMVYCWNWTGVREAFEEILGQEVYKR